MLRVIYIIPLRVIVPEMSAATFFPAEGRGHHGFRQPQQNFQLQGPQEVGVEARLTIVDGDPPGFFLERPQVRASNRLC